MLVKIDYSVLGTPGLTLVALAGTDNEKQITAALIDLLSSVARGFDVKDHVLACFGGAGGQHACALARSLGISKVFVHRFAGLHTQGLVGLQAFEFGDDAVLRATLKDGHLPEARFTLVPCTQLHSPSISSSPFEKGGRGDFQDTSSPPSKAKGGLVRRIYRRPVPLQTRPVVGPRGAHLLGMSEAPATRITGPFIVSGGWWHREVHREYYFTETEKGEILWVYFDSRRRRWFIHGVVD